MDMRNEFSAVVKQDGPWHIAYCARFLEQTGRVRREKHALKTCATRLPSFLSIGGKSLCDPLQLKPGKKSLLWDEARHLASTLTVARLRDAARR